jgi:UbiD family decarboxylase
LVEDLRTYLSLLKRKKILIETSHIVNTRFQLAVVARAAERRRKTILFRKESKSDMLTVANLVCTRQHLAAALK